MTKQTEGNMELSQQENIVKNNTAFALNLYKKVVSEGENLFLSPFSISSALAMTYAGARSETKEQMASALHFPLDDLPLHQAFSALQYKLAEIEKKGRVQILTANSLWPQKGYDFLAEYLDLLKQYYRVSITALDFGDPEPARGKINTWVEEKTRGKITEIIPAGLLDSLTRLVLANAIYFKGDWEIKFDQERTSSAPFYKTAEEMFQVPMMQHKGRYGYARNEGLQVLELPYAGRDLSMLIFLPDQIDGLCQLEEQLSTENLSRWTWNLRRMEVQVFLPRFEVRSSLNLNGILHSLGMVNAFGKADFSGMDGSKELYIAAVLHKAFLKVDEEGSEAAAATAVIMKTRSMPLPPPTFRADHPFLFVIRENSSGSILFMGRTYFPG